MAVAQSILDAQARQNAAIQAVSDKVDALIAAQAGAMTVAEQDAVAAQLTDAAVKLETIAAKS